MTLPVHIAPTTASRTATGQQQLLAVSQPLFVGPPDPRSVRQGVIGDCFAMAALSSVAAFQPEALTRALEKTPGGEVLFRYQSNNGEIERPIDARVLATGDGQLLGAYSTRSGECWPTVFERALAARAGPEPDHSIMLGYAILDRGGDAGWVLSALTGHPSVERSLNRMGEQMGACLLRYARNNRPMVLYNIGKTHSVAVVGVRQEAGMVLVDTHDTSGVVNPTFSRTYALHELQRKFESMVVTANWTAFHEATSPNVSGRRYLADVGIFDPTLTPERQRNWRSHRGPTFSERDTFERA